MIKHYIIIAVRNLRKHIIQNLIGIIGMAVGIAFFTIGYYWLNYETSYDGFHPNAGRIYKIYAVDKQTGKNNERLPLILGDKLTQEFPEVEKITMIYNNFGSSMKSGNRKLGSPDFRFVDEYFFEMFPPKIIAGKDNHLFYTPDELVITETLAKKYWNSPQEAIGVTLKDVHKNQLTIVAVMENPPRNTNFQAEGFRPDIFDRNKKGKRAADKEWYLMEQQIFVLLHKHADVKSFQQKLQNYMIDNKYNENLILKAVNITDARHTFGSELSFSITYIYTFVGAGLLLMLCALFNFLNLYMNRTLQRSREIKLRKTVGSNKGNIIKLLQTELSLQLLLILITGFCLLTLAAPYFEQQFETQIDKFSLSLYYILFSVIAFIIMFLTCLLFEIKFTNAPQLTRSSISKSHRIFRRVAIGIQLAVCIFFMMSSFVFYRQVSYMNNFDWGFNKEGIIKMTMDIEKRSDITQEISKLPIIKTFIPTGLFQISKEPQLWRGDVEWEGKPENTNYSTILFNVGETFLEGFEIPLIQGRNFQEEDITETYKWGFKINSSNKVIITENLAKIIGEENIIGKKLQIPAGVVFEDGTKPTEEKEIIGVVKDFHVTSLQNPLYPVVLAFFSDKWNGYFNYVKVDKGNEEKALNVLKEIYEKHKADGDPDEFAVESLEQLLADMNKSENASLQLFSVLALLCVLIAIFGIYSIMSSDLGRRKREIAVRKVSGAAFKDIVNMFLLEYSRLLLVANLFALPVAFYFMHNWLTQYAYRISISLPMFVIVILLSLIIVIATILYQVIIAARTNPAEVLKSE